MISSVPIAHEMAESPPKSVPNITTKRGFIKVRIDDCPDVMVRKLTKIHPMTPACLKKTNQCYFKPI